MRQLAFVALAAGAAGHGYINEPPSRTGATIEAAGACSYGSCLWFNQGCTIGCPKCLGVKGAGCGSEQGKATLPQALKTYSVSSGGCGSNPWCAPGSAPIMDPCGIAGGDTAQGSAGNGGDAPAGYKQGFKGSDMPPLSGVKRTWKAGAVVDAAWSMVANHGGGYQYRLCPKGQEASEECFQKTPLEFVGDEQYIQYCEENYVKPNEYPATVLNAFHGSKRPKVSPTELPPSQAYPKPCNMENRTSIPAVRISSGTVPAGSTWTRNPIPACGNALGGAFNFGCRAGGAPPKASAYQFPPIGPDLARPGYLLGGFGAGACGGCDQNVNPADCNVLGKVGRNNCSDGTGGKPDEITGQLFKWSVVDKVRVPQVPPGEYVISFRWDCEQTPQIWSQCSDVSIVAE